MPNSKNESIETSRYAMQQHPRSQSLARSQMAQMSSKLQAAGKSVRMWRDMPSAGCTHVYGMPWAMMKNVGLRLIVATNTPSACYPSIHARMLLTSCTSCKVKTSEFRTEGGGDDTIAPLFAEASGDADSPPFLREASCVKVQLVNRKITCHASLHLVAGKSDHTGN